MAEQLVIVLPDKKSEGFAARQETLIDMAIKNEELKALQAIDGKSIETLIKIRELWNEIVVFMSGYVKADTQAERIALVKMASEEQFNQIFDALGGASVIPPVNDAPSATG